MKAVCRRAIAIIRAQLDVLERALAEAPAAHVEAAAPITLDRCDTCENAPTVDVRTVRLGHRPVDLRVCADCARIAASRLVSKLEDSIAEGRTHAPADGIYS